MIRTHHASSSAIALCVIASDTGLCSAYNQNVFRAAVEFLTDFDKDDVRIVAVGKEALRYFQNRGYLITDKFIETRGIYTDELSDKIQKSLCSIFENETLKGVYVAHAHFGTMLRQRYKVEKFLNIDVPAMAGDKYILEPSREAIGRSLIDRYLTEKMRLIILDAFTSEHSARMVAMKTATDNADDMLLDLTLSRNKARQAAITKEVLEVSSVREAMRG
jgi:F-type H+-transporting ATPase subunit gamma